MHSEHHKHHGRWPGHSEKSELHRFVGLSIHQSMRLLHSFLREQGLSMSQFVVLQRTYHRGGIRVGEYSEMMAVSNAAASQLLDRLVKLGLMERREDENDRRIKLHAITDSGKDLVVESMLYQSGWISELQKTLSTQEQHTVDAALDLLLRKYEENFLEAGRCHHPGNNGESQ